MPFSLNWVRTSKPLDLKQIFVLISEPVLYAKILLFLPAVSFFQAIFDLLCRDVLFGQWCFCVCCFGISSKEHAPVVGNNGLTVWWWAPLLCWQPGKRIIVLGTHYLLGTHLFVRVAHTKVMSWVHTQTALPRRQHHKRQIDAMWEELDSFAQHRCTCDLEEGIKNVCPVTVLLYSHNDCDLEPSTFNSHVNLFQLLPFIH